MAYFTYSPFDKLRASGNCRPFVASLSNHERLKL